MKSLVMACAVLCAASFSAHAEDVTNAFIKCATTKEDRARLACYDKIGSDLAKANAPAATSKGYTPINLADFKVDIKGLSGKKMVVTALAQSMGQQLLLKSDELDTNPIFATYDKLPRDDRKKLANGCQMILCKGQFYGVVRPTPLGTLGLVVEQVDWN